jgi:hypothetical protein
MILREWILSLAVFGLFAAVYIGMSPSLARQHWDSLEYGHACEEHGLRALWGNHPLGQFLQCGTYRIIRRLGYQGRSLTVMKVMNATAAAAAMAAFFAFMIMIVRAGWLRSLGWSVTLGATYGMWRFAGTADIYGWATLSLIVAWGAAAWSFQRPSAERSVLAGAAFGVATLIHQFTGVILVVAIMALLQLLSEYSGRQRRVTVAVFGTAAALTIVVGYAALGMLATGSSSPDRVTAWLIGHGADPRYGLYFGLTGAKQAVHSLAGTLVYWSTRWPRGTKLFSVVAMSSLVLVSVTSIRYLPARARTMALSSIFSCIVGWLLIVWWLPTNPKFWLLTLPALVVWGEIAFAALKRRVAGRSGSRWARRFDAMPLLTGVLLLIGTGTVMWIERQPDVEFEESLEKWLRHSRPDDVLIENESLTAHLRFWGRRPRTLNLFDVLWASDDPADRFAKLRDLIDEAARQGRTVWFSPELEAGYEKTLALVGVTRQQVREFFHQYRREGPLFDYQVDGHARSVYRLLQPVD